jgi:hypothetical protein
MESRLHRAVFDTELRLASPGGGPDEVERSVRLHSNRLSTRNWTAGFGMTRVLRMSDHPAEGTTRPESGLTDDEFSPIWADDDRPRIPRVCAEPEALSAYLEYYRATVEMKCRGLIPEQARTRYMPPSTMSIHGLVRHLAGVERWWFQQNFERRDVPFLFFTADDPDLDFDPPSNADFAADLETWRGECAVSRKIVAAHDLDDTARPLDWNEDIDLRWLMLRMITEYAQHCGHLDLLREGVDGRTGA